MEWKLEGRGIRGVGSGDRVYSLLELLVLSLGYQLWTEKALFLWSKWKCNKYKPEEKFRGKEIITLGSRIGVP